MYSYQFIIFGKHRPAAASVLRARIGQRIAELNIDLNAVRFFDETTVSLRDPRAATVAAYFGVPGIKNANADLEALIGNSILVLPLVPSLDNFTASVPDSLLPINGSSWDETEEATERAVSVLFEGLSLLRSTRRLFLSYLRKETTGIAIQLFELFEKYGFDVFLDTHSVRPGEQFQEVLWHRLADTDVVVALDSPTFESSRWCGEEMANARTTSVQVLRLLWPGKKLLGPTSLNEYIELVPSGFQDPNLQVGDAARFTDVIEKKLVATVESLRSRALAARHTYLAAEFAAEAKSLGYSAVMQPERFLSLERKDGSFLAAVPSIGVPDALRYHEVEDMLDKHSRKHNDVVLLFDNRGIMRRWLAHLGWLNRQVSNVKSLSVSEIETFLRSKA